jgi:drug/metabolite transporter (DMT)-like permease
MRFAGEIAALCTALCWGAGSNFFAEAGKTMGAVVLNRLRITMALALLVAALLAARGSPWPFWASGREIAFLAASGLVGFVFGDNFYFRSMLILGPGRGSTLAWSMSARRVGCSREASGWLGPFGPGLPCMASFQRGRPGWGSACVRRSA